MEPFVNLFLALINKAQMNARRCFARVWPFVYRCQVPASRWAFLSNRASYAYKPGLAAIFGNPFATMSVSVAIPPPRSLTL